ERFEAISGIPAASLLGKTRDAYLDLDRAGNDYAEVTAAFERREPYTNKRLTMTLPDGRVLWFQISGRPYYSPEGAYLGYRGAASNITGAVLDEERRQQSQKLAALGRLAGGIAHDFNNVLGAIAGFAEFLSEDLPADSEQRRFAERIVQAAARAKGLIRQILSFARATPEPRRALPLAAVVQDTLPLLQAALPSTTRVELTAAPGDLWVLGNET